MGAGLKHSRDLIVELDETLPKIARNASSRPSSELVRTPLQSPASSEPASPIRPLILPSRYGGAETVITNETIQNHGDDADTVFIGPSEHEQREYLLQALHAGEQLPRNCGRPDYIFTLPLGGRDWGSQMTRTYDATRQKAGLTFQDLNEIAYVLSGVLHVDEEHAHFSKDEILQIRRDVLQMFYIKDQREDDLKRARFAPADEGIESTIDTTPVIKAIMAAYEDCESKDILPVLFIALHVFRKFHSWSRLRSDADCAMAMVGPILEEILHIQHEIKFTSANFATAHGQERKQELGQTGTSRQPDIIGCTADGKEIYFGELKGVHSTKQDINVDTLRVAIFAKDALDHLHCCQVQDPPLLTFQTKGKAVVFFLAAKRGNTIVHARLSAVQLPSNLTELNLDQEFFSVYSKFRRYLGPPGGISRTGVVSREYAEAMVWYWKAAEQGYAAAQCNIGELYYEGIGVSQDFTEAMIWFRKAAEQGYAAAQNHIGYLYREGLGVSQDQTKAITWFRKDAEQGHAVAQRIINKMV
ncbi:MAG: hypothetical protein J3R72DRAFT_525856 [Linnemannia gamsii]|nr:MAG: hypothetical protein J3R72DRAFT_525856 [Linnemannia gamsii]